MPVLIVYGIPENKLHRLEDFRNFLIKIVTDQKELSLKENQVSCFFPSDLRSSTESKEIIIFVDGLLDKPERTAVVRKQLAQVLAKKTEWFFNFTLRDRGESEERVVELVECFIRPFYENQGFGIVR